MNVTLATLLIDANTLEYPLNLSQVRRRLTDISLAEEPDSEELAALGYAVVYPADRPAGDVVTEGVPELASGEFRQTWIARAFTPEEVATLLASRQESLKQQFDQLRESTLAAGFPYDFGGASGVQHIQLRSEDIVNLLCLRMGAEEYVAAGQPESLMELRTREDVEIDVMASDMLAITRVALLYGMKTYKAVWTLKNQAKAATTLAELPQVPEVLTIV